MRKGTTKGPSCFSSFRLGNNLSLALRKPHPARRPNANAGEASPERRPASPWLSPAPPLRPESMESRAPSRCAGKEVVGASQRPKGSGTVGTQKKPTGSSHHFNIWLGSYMTTVLCLSIALIQKFGPCHCFEGTRLNPNPTRSKQIEVQTV